MELRINKLLIRDATINDAQQLQIWWNDGAVMEHAGFPDGLSISIERICRQIESESEETIRRQIIECDGIPIGEMNYRNQGDGSADIGIKICEADYQNKGLGKIILFHYCKALFEKGYQLIVLDTALENKRAQHVYETLGFEKIRVNENSWTDQRGSLRSSVAYCLLPNQLKEFK